VSEILKVESLTHTYSAGTPFEKKAVDNISFSVNEGEFIGLIGHTGSGKSTLIQHLNGLLKPTSGKIFVGGEDIHLSKENTRAARFAVGLVFQYPEYQLFEETVRADIAFGPKNMGLDKEEIDRRVLEAAEAVGLSKEQLDKSPFELSGGQKRRAALAGVLAMEPQVLVLDEPMAGLDPEGRKAIMGYVKEYHKKYGTTVIFVTHSMEDAAQSAQRLIVMSGGKILMQGSPEQVFERAEELRASGLDTPQITDLFTELKRRGLDVPTSIYTVEQAAEYLRKLKGGRD